MPLPQRGCRIGIDRRENPQEVFANLGRKKSVRHRSDSHHPFASRRVLDAVAFGRKQLARAAPEMTINILNSR
jgi:hypothetical protein